MPRLSVPAAALAALFALSAHARPDDALEDGVYQLRFEGDGRKVTLSDGTPALLGKRLSASIGKATALKSWTNDNRRFHLAVTDLGPLPPEVTKEQSALVVGGVVLHIGRPDKLPEGGRITTSANVESPDAARTLAEKYRVERVLRKHPGHRFEARWTPDAPAFRAGEPVTLKLALKNTGTTSMRFTFGGKQRGPRNNQFRFVAQEGQDGKGLPDTGDAQNFGGIMSVRTLRPGETFRGEVDVTKWFTFPRPGTYRVTGILELPILDPEADGFGPTVWDDLAVGECDVRIQ